MAGFSISPDFLAGRSVAPDDVFRALIRSYDASTGTVLWQTLTDGMIYALTASPSYVIAAGQVPSHKRGSTDFMLWAFDPQTGGLLWTDRTVSPGSNNAAMAIAAQDDLLVAAGRIDNGKGAVRVYQLQ